MYLNVTKYTSTLVIPANQQVAWMTLSAPQFGRIVRLFVVQTSGTVENVACLIDVFDSAAAMTANALDILQYQVLPQLALAGNATNVSTFTPQAYANNDNGNVQRGQGLYARINSQSNNTKTYRVTIVVEN
jgi:hypothetical protein